MSEWRDSPLGKVATLQRGFDLPARSRRPGKVPIVSSSGVSGWHDRAMVKAPGVVTGRYGTIGEVFYEENDFWPLNTTLWVSNYHGNDQRFVYYLLQRIDYAMHSGKSGVPGVNRNDLHGELVHVPVSVAEQQSISAILKDVDALVSKLERLIAKKRAIKQGMMQELLTGRTRLPGYSVSWSETRLGDVASGGRGAGLSKSSIVASGRNPCLLYGELFTTYSRVIESVKSFTNEVSGVRSVGGEVLLPGSTTTTAEDLATASALLQCGVLLGGDVNIIRPNRHKIDSVWLAYYLTNQLKNQIAEAGQGITIVHLYVRSLLTLEIELPPLPEQIAIGSALQDADAEIEALERRLEATRDIKQGMMQELLTGRTRLPVDEEVAV